MTNLYHTGDATSAASITMSKEDRDELQADRLAKIQEEG